MHCSALLDYVIKIKNIIDTLTVKIFLKYPSFILLYISNLLQKLAFFSEYVLDITAKEQVVGCRSLQ